VAKPLRSTFSVYPNAHPNIDYSLLPLPVMSSAGGIRRRTGHASDAASSPPSDFPASQDDEHVAAVYRDPVRGLAVGIPDVHCMLTCWLSANRSRAVRLNSCWRAPGVA